jgi:hypothetical protein
MIHWIKALYDEGRGSSIRAIAKQLRVSRNTVKKYPGWTKSRLPRTGSGRGAASAWTFIVPISSTCWRPTRG